MSNCVTASVEFFFKGNKISSSIDLDIDHHMQSTGKLPVLYPLLARASALDMYSYEYEMMQTEMVLFSQPEGMIAEFIHEGQLDIAGFEKAWLESEILEQLKAIANKYLTADHSKLSDELIAALLEAYRLGKSTA